LPGGGTQVPASFRRAVLSLINPFCAALAKIELSRVKNRKIIAQKNIDRKSLFLQLHGMQIGKPSQESSN
jgi:hypothetical protein